MQSDPDPHRNVLIWLYAAILFDLVSFIFLAISKQIGIKM
jgi:hypothetical protein